MENEALEKIAIKQAEKSAPLLERFGYDPKSYARIVLNAAARSSVAETGTPLTQCTPQSVAMCLLACMEAGLIPDGKQAAIVPFRHHKTKGYIAQLLPMTEGKMLLATRATPGLVFEAHVVYSSDDYDYGVGDNLDLVLRWRPNPTGERTRENIVAVFALGRVPGAAYPAHCWLWRDEVDRLRAMSPASQGAFWTDHYEEMAKKSALSRVCKLLPNSTRSVEAYQGPPSPPQPGVGAPEPPPVQSDAGRNEAPPEPPPPLPPPPPLSMEPEGKPTLPLEPDLTSAPF